MTGRRQDSFVDGPKQADWLRIFSLGLIGGGTFVAIELALRDLPPLWVAALRILFGAFCMGLIWWRQGWRLFGAPVGPGLAARLLAVALLSTVIPFSLISWGQQYVTSGFAAIAMASSALMVCGMARLFLPDERLGPRRLAGLGLGFVGVICLVGPGALWARDGLALAAQLAVLSAAACYAGCSIIVRRLPEVNPVGLVSVMLGIASAVIVPVAALVEGWPGLPGPVAGGAVLALAVVSTAGSNLLGTLVIRSAGPTFMGITNYLTPVFAIAVAWAVLGEAVTLNMWIGLGFIVAGLAVAQIGLRLRAPAGWRSIRLGLGRRGRTALGLAAEGHRAKG